MYARQVTMQLKPKGQANFTRAIETEILPLLREQRGFKDEITFVIPDQTKAVAISLWDQKENADAYDRATYPKVLKALTAVVEGTPRVETYEVTNSTFHKLAAGGLPV
jgi:heme-degrading monooxygenase HmoA